MNGNEFMKKFELFLVIEAVLLTLAMLTILQASFPRFILALVLLLMALRYYNLAEKTDFILTTGLLILFFITMLNPFAVLAICIGVIYLLVNHFAQVKKKNRYALINYSDDGIKAHHKKNKWFGLQQHQSSDHYAFDDINIIRLSGNDIIDLDNVIVAGKSNLIMIRKIYGPTRIIVPVDVGIRLNCSSIYGKVKFLNQDDYDLRNESIILESSDYDSSKKNVKVVINVIAGEVEVMSA